MFLYYIYDLETIDFHNTIIEKLYSKFAKLFFKKLMKLIKPSYNIFYQKEGIQGIYESIENAGRTCYKSEDKITPTSAKDFTERMVKSGHHAMLEFGTVYLDLPQSAKDCYKIQSKYHSNKYSIENYSDKNHSQTHWYITTNYRVLIENGWLDDLKHLCEPTEFHEKRVCVRFTTDRGVSHELVRHRVFSFAQESTRYCNYSKDKFGNELAFIIPSNLDEEKLNQYGPYQTVVRDKKSPESIFISSLNNAENDYLELLETGWSPQQARQVLPNALKTEINMCGFTSDWEHFFELRDDKAAHPDMQALAKPLHQEFKNKNYV